MFFSGFLSLVIGILSFTISYYCLLLMIPLIVILILKKLPRSYLITSLVCLAIGLSFSFLPRGSEGDKELLGICVLRREKYIYFLTIEGKYLVYDDGQVPLFSIARITGFSERALFSHHESGFDYRGYLETQGIFYKLSADSVRLVFDTHYRLDFLRDHCFSYLNTENRAVIGTILFGDSTSKIEQNSLLQDLGLTTAISLGGFHLSFFLSIIRKLLGKRFKRVYPICEIVFIGLFLFLSGFRYAMRRIFLIRILYLVNSHKRRLSQLGLLSLAGMIMLIFEPYSLLSSSFYYSFPFLFFIRIFKNTIPRKRFFFPLLLICFYLPIRLKTSPIFYLLGPISQIILLPLSHLIFLLAVPLLAIPPLGLIMNPICSLFFKIVILVHENSPVLVNGELSIFIILLMYVPIIFFFILRTYNFKREAHATLVLSLLSTCLVFLPDLGEHHEIDFIDVGQGDCTLVRYEGTDILIDTGGDASVDIATECLIPFFYSQKIRKLDAVIITHLDYDHYGALENLKADFPIDEIYYYHDFLNEEDHSITIDSITITNLNDYHISNDSNDNSAVYYMRLGEKTLLVMGDAPKEVEELIIEEYPDLTADYLKLGHHGSKTSSSKVFLEQVDPELAIISAGYNNIYRHPSEETISTLEECDITYRRTDLEGTIRVEF